MTDTDSHHNRIGTTLKEDELTGSANFNSWIIDARAHLRKKKDKASSESLWQTIQTPLPETENDTEKDKAYLAKQVRHENAADELVSSIDISVKQKLEEQDFNDGYLLLKHIKDLYEADGEVEVIEAWRDLITCRPESENRANVESWLIRIKKLSERIDTSAIKLTTDLRTLLVLQMGISDIGEYRSMAQVWRATPNMTAQKAVNMLREEARKHEDRSKDTSDMRALYGLRGKGCQTCGKEGHTKEQCKKNRTCYNCQEKGHISKFCPKKKRKVSDSSDSEGDSVVNSLWTI